MNNLIHRCPLMQKDNRLISFGAQTNGNVFMNWESFLLLSDCRKIDCRQFVKQNSQFLLYLLVFNDGCERWFSQASICTGVCGSPAAAPLKMDAKAHVGALTPSIR